MELMRKHRNKGHVEQDGVVISGTGKGDVVAERGVSSSTRASNQEAGLAFQWQLKMLASFPHHETFLGCWKVIHLT